jgi:hypothetical protein
MFIARVFGQLHERKATKKDGTEFTVRYQEAELIRRNQRPRVVKISVQNGTRYEEGLYTLAPESFRPDKFERLEMDFPELVPLSDALKIGEQEFKAFAGRKLT